MNDHAKNLLIKLREKAKGDEHSVDVNGMLAVIEFENGRMRHEVDRLAWQELIENGLIIEYDAGLGITKKGMDFQ